MKLFKLTIIYVQNSISYQQYEVPTSGQASDRSLIMILANRQDKRMLRELEASLAHSCGLYNLALQLD